MDNFPSHRRLRLPLVAAISLCLLLLTAAPGGAQEGMRSETARSLASFLDSRGMGLHLNYGGTPYTDVEGQVLPQLRELGIRRVRGGCTGAGDEECLARIEQLGRAGVTFTYIFHGQSMDEVREIATRLVRAGALEAVEGPNESDLSFMGFSYQGETFPEGTRAYLRDLHATIKGDPELAHLPIINASVGWGASYADPTPNGDPGLGSVEQWVDRGNMHVYAYESREVSGDLDTWYLPYARQASGDKPLWATETGYGEANGVPVSDHAHGRYMPRLALELFNHGVELAHVHELHDVDPGGFGQIRSDGTPKPGFTSSANLAAILADEGDAIEPGVLEYATSIPIGDDHDPATHEPHHTLLQRSDGTFFLILWQDRDSQREDVPDVEVNLTLGTDIAEARTYLPLEGTEPLSTTADPDTLTLSVPDHALVVELRPASTQAAQPEQPAAGVDPSGFLGGLLAALRALFA